MKNGDKYAYTVKMGAKGQIVIPSEAREVFDFKPGDTILLLGDKQKGLALVKGEQFSELFEKLLTENK